MPKDGERKRDNFLQDGDLFSGVPTKIGNVKKGTGIDSTVLKPGEAISFNFQSAEKVIEFLATHDIPAQPYAYGGKREIRIKAEHVEKFKKLHSRILKEEFEGIPPFKVTRAEVDPVDTRSTMLYFKKYHPKVYHRDFWCFDPDCEYCAKKGI